MIPVHLGSVTRVYFTNLDRSRVTCAGSDVQGLIILNKQKRPMIEWVSEGQKKLYTISQFFKAVTNTPLLEKGTLKSHKLITQVIHGPKYSSLIPRQTHVTLSRRSNTSLRGQRNLSLVFCFLQLISVTTSPTIPILRGSPENCGKTFLRHKEK